MTRETVLQDIKQRFQEDIIDLVDKSAKRVYIEIKTEAINRVARFIFEELGARFNIASGIDARQHIEILYHFIIEDINLLISLRVKLDRAKPQINSLTPIMEGANWIEREIHELLGVQFFGHPDLRRLLLSEEWPQGNYPLRIDYKEWDNQAVRERI